MQLSAEIAGDGRLLICHIVEIKCIKHKKVFKVLPVHWHKIFKSDTKREKGVFLSKMDSSISKDVTSDVDCNLIMLINPFQLRFRS